MWVIADKFEINSFKHLFDTFPFICNILELTLHFSFLFLLMLICLMSEKHGLESFVACKCVSLIHSMKPSSFFLFTSLDLLFCPDPT